MPAGLGVDVGELHGLERGPVGGHRFEALEQDVFANPIDDQTQGGEQKVVLLGVLGAEQALFAPEEAIGGVFVAADVEDRRRHQLGLGDVAPGCGHGLMGSGFEIEGGHMGQNPLAGQTTAADPLALLGHGTTP
jgi:hypothetical protein